METHKVKCEYYSALNAQTSNYIFGKGASAPTPFFMSETPNIITSVPRYSDGEVDRAFMKELLTGFELERKTEGKREMQARKEAHELRGKAHPTLGRPVATMPAREFFRLTKKYGHEQVHSKEFLQYYNKKFPELSPNKI